MSERKFDLAVGILLVLLLLQCYKILILRPVVRASIPAALKHGADRFQGASVQEAGESQGTTELSRIPSGTTAGAPASYKPPPQGQGKGREQVELHVPDYLRAIVLLESQPGLGLKASQANEILKRLREFPGLYDRIPACEAAIYKTLTPGQLQALGNILRSSPPVVRQGPPEIVHRPMAAKGLRWLEEKIREP